jgi:hypothetical protein
MKKYFAISLIFFVGINESAAFANLQGVTQAPLAASEKAGRIGVVAAVKGQADIRRPDGPPGLIVASGSPVFLGDEVSTDDKGQMQILLLDETIFTIGPNSSIVIDKFVYDPGTEDGEIKVRIVKGIFRFVTGRISKKEPANMAVDLPVGTIGIRGTMIAGEVRGNESLVALLGPGGNQSNHTPGSFVLSNTVNGEVKTTHVDQAGFGSEIKGEDLPPTPNTRIPDSLLNRLTGEFSVQAKEGDSNSNSGSESLGSGADSGSESKQQQDGEGQGQVDTQALAADFMESTGLGEGEGGSAQDFFNAFGNLSAEELQALCGGDCSSFSEFLILDGQFDFLLPPPENAASFEDIRSVTSGSRYFDNGTDTDSTNNTLELFNSSGQLLGFGFDIQADIQFGNQLFLGGNSKIAHDGSTGAFGDFSFKLDNDPLKATGGAIDYSNSSTFPDGNEFAFGGEVSSHIEGIENEITTGNCAACTADVFVALRNTDSTVNPGDGISEIGVTLSVELRIRDSMGTLIAKSDFENDVLVGRAQSAGSDVSGVSP